ncbi:MAG: VOC family protein [Candidatus Malihini olakiniferum]
MNIDCIELPWPSQLPYLKEGREHVQLV